MRLSEFLDEGPHGAALRMGRRSRGVRVVITLLVGALLLANFGVAVAVAWGAANVALEGWLLVCQIRFRPGQPRRASTAIRLGTIAAFSAVWSTMAGFAWIHGSPGMKFAALVVLFGLLIEAVKYAGLSRAAFVFLAPFPIAALIIAAVLFGGFQGAERIFVIAALAGLSVYIVNAARLMRANAQALEQAQADAQAANHAKSAFLAMMSHELRTPMNGVMGMAHALASTRLDRRQTDYLDTIVQSGDGLMAILNDILDLSKIEAGKLELEIVDFDIAALTGQLHRLWQETARAKGVDLVLEIAPGAPAWLAGDPVRVRQVLLNLIANAVKFTPRGGVHVAVGPGLAGGVEISVADTGIGISAQQQARLFQPFTQGEASTTRRFGGSGLGLSICHQLVTLMGGTIGVVSQLDEGSTFTVVLPLAAGAAPAVVAAPTPRPAGLQGRRILVVDDNRANRIVAQALLEAVGAVVALADDGRQGLDRLAAEAFDLVLMDVHMPTMDGIEALSRIRAGQGGPAGVPVIALTADGMSGEAERLLALGFDDVQHKPIQPAQLVRAVADWCDAPSREEPLLARAS
jgi:signal transduction histidine kinase/ActR/RegA family two-component response regulator